MGETRVDLLHLLEDLRDAYPGALEETILTEIIANSLDSGAARISFVTDPAGPTLTVLDDGSGMVRRDLRHFHDLAASTKSRGQGIGFAGVGIKLGLLACEEVVTETRRASQHVAAQGTLAVGAAAGPRRGRAWHRGAAQAQEPALAAPRSGLHREHHPASLRAAARRRFPRHARAALSMRRGVRGERTHGGERPRARRTLGAGDPRGPQTQGLGVGFPGARVGATRRGSTWRRGEHARQGHQARLGLARPLAGDPRSGRRADRGAATRRLPDAQQGRFPAHGPTRRRVPFVPQGDPGSRLGAAPRMGRDARRRRGLAAPQDPPSRARSANGAGRSRRRLSVAGDARRALPGRAEEAADREARRRRDAAAGRNPSWRVAASRRAASRRRRRRQTVEHVERRDR